MKTLLVGPYLPAKDGIADYTAILRTGLIDAGIDVRVLASRPDPTAPPEVLGSLPHRGAMAGTAARIRAWQPDVVHVQFATAAFGSRTPRLLRWLASVDDPEVRRVITCHEVTRDLTILRGAGVRIYRRLAQWAQTLIVHTEPAAAALREIGVDAHQIRRIPHFSASLPQPACTPADLRQRHGIESARVLLAFGFIHPDKGLPDLVAALRLLIDQDPDATGDVRLVVAGTVRRRVGMFRISESRDWAHLARVKSQVRRLGLADRVVMTGYVPSGEMAPWFAAAAAVVLPYRRIEQSGVASLVIAAGRPMLCSTVGELARHPATVAGSFPPRDPAALAAVISRELRSPSPSLSTGPELSRSLAEVVAATAEVYRVMPRHQLPAPRPIIEPGDAVAV